MEFTDTGIRIRPQGPGGISGMGSGERQLWSMIGAMGVGPEATKAFMDAFIEPVKESDE